MNYEKFRGIVVKGIDYLESDKLLTILTFEKGRVTVRAKGVKKKGARLTHLARQFFYGEFECIESRGRYILTGGSRSHDFSLISADIDKYYHACHYADIALAVIMEDHPDERMMRLLLNTLHVLTKDGVNPALLTSIYELRTAVLAGFAPVTDECVICGSEKDNMLFSITEGGTVCCANGIKMDNDIHKVIRAVSNCGMKELFSLSVPMESLETLCSISHRYLEAVFERAFNTLDGIKNI